MMKTIGREKAQKIFNREIREIRGSKAIEMGRGWNASLPKDTKRRAIPTVELK
jgi:hypothetical protein